jgi:4-amino-4-deoxy-L-arabinose transferase-like glycosyltransferase
LRAGEGTGKPGERESSSLHGAAYWLWVAAILALVALHAVHPRADFPNHSPWMDYAKYTDEGWYGKAAIDHYVLGSWYMPGDFNAAVALPVLPALELGLFHFTGPGLAAARLLVFAVFAANLLLVYFLVRTLAERWTALLAVTLLASNAFLYSFSRLAILEPLLVFFLLASWMLALHLPQSPIARNAALAACGIVICLMILTKTTGLFLLPSTLFLIWNRTGPGLSPRMKAIAVTAIAAALPWSGYYFLWVRPRYLVDYRYFFIANQYGHPATLAACASNLWDALHATLWISPALVIVSLALAALSLLYFRSLWRNPLFIASLLAIAAYTVFIAWHNNLQPRYYQVIAFPLMIVIALAAQQLVGASFRIGSNASRSGFLKTTGAAAATIAIVVSTAANSSQVISWARHPEYTWFNAATALTRYVDQHPNGNRLLLSISGDDIALITGLPAICDDFGPWDLPARTQHYQPGWFAAWNEVDEGTAADLATQYSMEQVAGFDAFDDPDRNHLILYKLHPLEDEK